MTNAEGTMTAAEGMAATTSAERDDSGGGRGSDDGGGGWRDNVTVGNKGRRREVSAARPSISGVTQSGPCPTLRSETVLTPQS